MKEAMQRKKEVRCNAMMKIHKEKMKDCRGKHKAETKQLEMQNTARSTITRTCQADS